ncbi:MAG: MarR family transcriptional regulator [Bacillota bacterium]
MELTEGKRERLRKLEEVFLEVARNISSKITQSADLTLTHPQFFMLKRLGTGPATVSEMAEYMDVSLSAITSMADRLVKMGYITRKRSEEDRRLVWLELTGPGRVILEKTITKRREIVNGLLGRLAEEDLEALYTIYSKVLSLMSEKREAGGGI